MNGHFLGFFPQNLTILIHVQLLLKGKALFNLILKKKAIPYSL